MFPELKQLIAAMKLSSPNKKIQKALPPKLLRYMAMASSAGIVNEPVDHATDLIIGAFFFAMRACEYTWSSRKGKTKMVTMGGTKFFDTNRQEIPQEHHKRILNAEYVWVLFEEQKNGERFESRTQRRTDHNLLCPVRSFARVVIRIRLFVNKHSRETPLCSINSKVQKSKFVSQTFTLHLLRRICSNYGGCRTFGFEEKEIGNKSVRSGAAMALFLMNHSAEHIMMLGRWKSKVFLDYIRPQVLQWIDLFSRDMISFDNFHELCLDQKDRRRNEGRSSRIETLENLEIPSLMIQEF